MATKRQKTKNSLWEVIMTAARCREHAGNILRQGAADLMPEVMEQANADLAKAKMTVYWMEQNIGRDDPHTCAARLLMLNLLAHMKAVEDVAGALDSAKKIYVMRFDEKKDEIAP